MYRAAQALGASSHTFVCVFCLYFQFLATTFTYLSASWTDLVKTLPPHLGRSLRALLPHCVYMIPVSDYHTICHVMSYIILPRLVTYFCLLHKFLKNQDQFVRMHYIDGYRMNSIVCVDVHLYQKTHFLVESHYNTLVSWSVACQKSHQMPRRLQL